MKSEAPLVTSFLICALVFAAVFGLAQWYLAKDLTWAIPLMSVILVAIPKVYQWLRYGPESTIEAQERYDARQARKVD